VVDASVRRKFSMSLYPHDSAFQLPEKPIIVADVPVTLRKKMSFIMSREGHVEFNGSSFEDALQFLQDHDRTQGELISPTGVWSVVRIRDLSQEEGEKWLGLRHHY
jgi:hypothetical protein